MREEQCAIATRAAPSFLRIGHFELFGRRARQGDPTAKRQLAALFDHALGREFPELAEESTPAGAGRPDTDTADTSPDGPALPAAEMVVAVLRTTMRRLAKLAVGWVR